MTTDEMLKEDLRELKSKQEKQHEEITHLRELIGNLAHIQQSTTENVNLLTSDVKEMLKQSLTYDILEKEIIMINRRIDDIDDSRSWLTKLIIGAIIVAVLGLLFDMKTTKILTK